MIENTLENKAKFFAQYWGQDIIQVNMTEWNNKTRIVDYVTMESDSFKKFNLILKSIKRITDIDAIKVSELILFVKFNESTENKVINEMEHDQCRVYNSGSFTTLYSDFYCRPQQGDPAREIPGCVYDYLRSKGYALPYMGLSVEAMIEYGWIKLSE